VINEKHGSFKEFCSNDMKVKEKQFFMRPIAEKSTELIPQGEFA
jgi:hypothetical protein